MGGLGASCFGGSSLGGFGCCGLGDSRFGGFSLGGWGFGLGCSSLGGWGCDLTGSSLGGCGFGTDEVGGFSWGWPHCALLQSTGLLITAVQAFASF